MSDKTKVAAAGAASKNPAKASDGKKSAEKSPAKAKHFVNPFSLTDPLQMKFVNCIMKDGKKELARRILADCFAEMNRRGEKDVMKAFEKAVQNTTPTMEVRPKRVGGSVYQIPMEVKPKRQQSLSIRWILAAARSRKGQPMYKRLASEFMDAANELGNAFSKKTEAHRSAQANKAFAHLARY